MKLKESLSEDIVSVQMNYVLSSDKKEIVTCSLMRNRLMKITKQYQWVRMVHEYLNVFGNIMKSDSSITHLIEEKGVSDGNVKIYEKIIR